MSEETAILLFGSEVRVYYECPTCFKGWNEVTNSNVVSSTSELKLCDYCEKMKMTYYDDAMITTRRLEVMGSANLRRLPETLRLMWKCFETKE